MSRIPSAFEDGPCTEDVGFERTHRIFVRAFDYRLCSEMKNGLDTLLFQNFSNGHIRCHVAANVRNFFTHVRISQGERGQRLFYIENEYTSARRGEFRRERISNEARASRDEDLPPLPEQTFRHYHIFHGEFPTFHSAFKSSMSRTVSIHCQ